MKLVRFGPVGHERPGVLRDDVVVDVTDVVGDFDAAFLAAAVCGPWPARSRNATTYRGIPQPRSPVGARPSHRPGKVVCIGLNYAVHAEESGMELPEEPVVFFKAPSTVVGPEDDVLIPVGGTKTDWEVELGVVIGGTGRYLGSEQEAADIIAGYCVSHDVLSGTSSSSAAASGSRGSPARRSTRSVPGW